jgi:hypothetical protein
MPGPRPVSEGSNQPAHGLQGSHRNRCQRPAGSASGRRVASSPWRKLNPHLSRSLAHQAHESDQALEHGDRLSALADPLPLEQCCWRRGDSPHVPRGSWRETPPLWNHTRATARTRHGKGVPAHSTSHCSPELSLSLSRPARSRCRARSPEREDQQIAMIRSPIAPRDRPSWFRTAVGKEFGTTAIPRRHPRHVLGRR